MQSIPEWKKLILVTGTSGAGLSTALKIFEDLGVKAVDNIPLALIDQLVGPRGGNRRASACSRGWMHAPPASALSP